MPHRSPTPAIGWLRPTIPGRDLPAPEPRSRTLGDPLDRRPRPHGHRGLPRLAGGVHAGHRCLVGVDPALRPRGPRRDRSGAVHVLPVGRRRRPREGRHRDDGGSRCSSRPTTRASRSSCRRSRPPWRCESTTRRGSSTTATGRRWPGWPGSWGRTTSPGRARATPRPATSTMPWRSIEADLIAVLDADHVASPDFLAHTLGYFDDPKVAIVQTPQEFYNLESFEHERAVTEVASRRATSSAPRAGPLLSDPPARQEPLGWSVLVRYRRGRPGRGAARRRRRRDRHDHRGHPHDDPPPPRGLADVYHNEVLARGLAAGDADTYQLQRIAGAPARCRSSAARTRCSSRASRSRSGWPTRRRCSAGSMPGGRWATSCCRRGRRHGCCPDPRGRPDLRGRFRHDVHPRAAGAARPVAAAAIGRCSRSCSSSSG